MNIRNPYRNDHGTDGRRNFRVYAIEGALFSLASVFVSQDAVLPVFLSRLGASPGTIALIPVAAQLGQGLPGSLVSGSVQRLATKKEYIIVAGMGQRLPWLLIGLATPLLAHGDRSALVAVTLVCFLISSISGGLAAPAFVDLVATTVTPSRRGSLSALRSGVGYLLGVGGGFVVRAVLAGIVYPWNYSLLFLIAALVFAANLALFSRIREPRGLHASPGQEEGFYRRTWAVLAGDPGFRSHVAAKTCFSLSLATCAFFPVHLVRILGLDDAATGIFLVVAGLTYTVANPLLGRVGDRFGYRPVMIAGSAVLVAAGMVGMSGYAGIASLGMISAAAVARTANLMSWNLEMDFAPPGRIPVFVGASGAVVGLAAPLGLVAGFLAGRFGYGAVFAMTAITAAVCLALYILRVPDPRTRTRKVTNGGTPK